MQNGCVIKMDIFWWTYFDTHMYENVDEGEINIIIQWVYNAGVLDCVVLFWNIWSCASQSIEK